MNLTSISNEISDCLTIKEINLLLDKIKECLEYRSRMNSIKSISNLSKKIANRIQ